MLHFLVHKCQLLLKRGQGGKNNQAGQEAWVSPSLRKQMPPATVVPPQRGIHFLVVRKRSFSGQKYREKGLMGTAGEAGERPNDNEEPRGKGIKAIKIVKVLMGTPSFLYLPGVGAPPGREKSDLARPGLCSLCEASLHS
ncbi:hypothetical protein Nepgr_004116 [Nepenthes gracilis]|uniref:Uncharacterized protein n=1 Tax=Nepenthes gracilis TaxID=150966 RepID=A0AAD3XER3_NEPGR|nr:hypothetical protein Nepgr_004116 [Nepenthes gracilis]